MLLETLCYHAQQAAEKALKAVLVAFELPFPYTHNLQTLLDLLPAFLETTGDVRRAALLTDFAVAMRYPAALEPVEDHEYEQALKLAAACIEWAERAIASRS